MSTIGNDKSGGHLRLGRSGSIEQYYQGQDSNYAAGLPSRRVTPLLWIGVAFSLVVWSLTAVVLYSLADPILTWFASLAGLILDSGKGLATIAGVEKQIAGVMGNIDTNSVLGQLIALLNLILKPLIVAGWAFGSIFILLLPLFARRVRRLIISMTGGR